jgi:hypothetical protein
LSYKYKRIRLKNGLTRDEHRLIMEEYLGRKLDTYEVVHHCNENGKDNRIENLELMLLKYHSQEHQSTEENRLRNIKTGKIKRHRIPKYMRWCYNCENFLPVDDFSRDKTNWHEYHSICKKCKCIKKKLRYKKIKIKI